MGHGGRNRGAQRVGQSHQPQKPIVEIMLIGGQGFARKTRLGHAQDAQAFGGHGIHRLHHRFARGHCKMAQGGNRLGRPFGRNHVVALAMGGKVGFVPDLRHRQKCGGQRIGPDQGAALTRQRLAGAQIGLCQRVKRFLHWIVRFRRRRHDTCSAQFPEGIRHGVFADIERLAIRQMQRRDGHAVFGQRPGFVGTKHRRRPQRFNR